MAGTRAREGSLAATYNDPPPPYTRTENTATQAQASGPVLPPASASASTATVVSWVNLKRVPPIDFSPNAIKFPSVARGFRPGNSIWNYDIGVSENAPKFRLCVSPTSLRATFHKTEVARLQNGKKSVTTTPMATISQVGGAEDEHHALMTLNDARKTRIDLYVQHGPFRPQQKRTTEFRMDVNGRVEEFQWRLSRGAEVKTTAGAKRGFKLVRMGARQPGTGPAATERRGGFSSDNREVVAVIVPGSDLGRDIEFTFSFMGSGLTGELGAAWETVAVFSGAWKWCGAFVSHVYA
ncbi:hypothetical protein Cob_v008224 [Colletotrichum orbiculare MAFF 240422]|uniref:Uncharacterized protein n=1 Tax=Colletotrichum orbiculare (strain 104-T / ATCC 96160 / CBS 514.97 / LARS 414 / MAFF 240422) TaxID=1213857 RepID=N4VEL3_COLOR|nr:hypothetical protein Cob_v008224 [Colletotrichum orbiculare MAFF 240422]